jgi:hypothetical protein
LRGTHTFMEVFKTFEPYKKNVLLLYGLQFNLNIIYLIVSDNIHFMFKEFFFMMLLLLKKCNILKEGIFSLS